MNENTSDKAELSFVIEPWGDSEQLTGRRDRMEKFTADAMERARATVIELGHSFSETIEKIPGSVDYIDLKFGLKFDAEAGVVVSKVSAQASLDVTLRIKASE